MSTPVRDLNEIAGKSPEKSPRKRTAAEPAEDEPARKRASPDTIVAAGNDTSRRSPRKASKRNSSVVAGTDTPKKSPKKSLKRKSSGRPVAERRSGEDGFDIPAGDSPKSARQKTSASGVPSPNRVEPQPKKKMRLKIAKDKKHNPSPLKGIPYGALNAETVPGVTLSSTDSPAKNTRNKTANPLLTISRNMLVKQPQVVVPPSPRQARRKSNLRNAESAGDAEPADGETEQANSFFDNRSTDRDELARQSQALVDDANELNDHEEVDKDNSAPTTPKKSRGRTRKTPRGKATVSNESASGQEDEKKRKDKEQKEAKKQAQREKDRKQQAANAAETAEYFLQETEARRKTFMTGIEDPATYLGLFEAFADLGAAALDVSSMFPPYSPKTKMGTRAGAIARNIDVLTQAYEQCRGRGANVLRDESGVGETLSQLRQRSSVGTKNERPFLHGNKDQEGDDTVRDLFGYLIPRCSILLKKVLQVRWDGGLSLKECKEVRKVAKILMDLCILAMEWDPRPTTLEVGIMSRVKQKISSGAASVRQRLGQIIEYEERRAWERRMEAERMERIREAQEQRLTFRQREGLRIQRAKPSIQQAPDELDSELGLRRWQQPEIPATPSPRLQRRLTEEIPAPYPNAEWTRKEDMALLDSLQEYTEKDRFEQILVHCPRLQHKNVDELISRARFHRRSCETKAKEEGYWWLLNVAL